ncbi:putative glycosidase CRH2 [Massospora cicadina]|nr:putative glycosidase CRH2 [Massospora cicadina]
MGVLGHGAGVCTLTPSCDEWSPCCNTAGWCGASYGFCGAGCHEEGNFNSTRCLPKPACSDGTFKVSTDRIAEEVGFNGDYINRDFTVQGEYSIEGEGILLKLSKPGTGTVLRSTRYINFGRISADLSMKRVGGVVTSFITMADNKDEVDFEFVGNGEIQSNWYYRGIVPEYKDNHQKIISLPTTTHNYAIDLTQDAITWLIDGIPVRTLPRKDDQFPSTPTRFSFSIWDGSSGKLVPGSGRVGWSTGTSSSQVAPLPSPSPISKCNATAHPPPR